MAATNRPNALEPALRRFDRFDLEINIPVPDMGGRADILRIKTRDMSLSPEVDLDSVALDTQGFCGADLAKLVFEAAMLSVREKLPEIDLEADRVPRALLDTLSVQPEHVRRALTHQPVVAARDGDRGAQRQVGGYRHGRPCRARGC